MFRAIRASCSLVVWEMCACAQRRLGDLAPWAGGLGGLWPARVLGVAAPTILYLAKLKLLLSRVVSITHGWAMRACAQGGSGGPCSPSEAHGRACFFVFVCFSFRTKNSSLVHIGQMSITAHRRDGDSRMGELAARTRKQEGLGGREPPILYLAKLKIKAFLLLTLSRVVDRTN